MGEDFTLYVHRDYTARLFPWWGTMAHGIAHVGESGGGVWRARSRDKLVEKMERSALKFHRRWGNPDNPTIRVEDRYRAP